jgi:hypothetical protein
MEKDSLISLPLQISELQKVLVFTGASILSFFVPFTLGHPQWLVGTAVNACLFLGAVYLPKKYFLPLAILPSLGILARGLVFGPFTYFLVYFLPFIWLGNLVLILVFKNLFSRFGYIFSVVAAAGAKFLFLFIIANVYFKFSIIPALFLQSMGFNQLATALVGGLVSFIIFKFYGRLISRSPRVN